MKDFQFHELTEGCGFPSSQTISLPLKSNSSSKIRQEAKTWTCFNIRCSNSQRAATSLVRTSFPYIQILKYHFKHKRHSNQLYGNLITITITYYGLHNQVKTPYVKAFRKKVNLSFDRVLLSKAHDNFQLEFIKKYIDIINKVADAKETLHQISTLRKLTILY